MSTGPVIFDRGLPGIARYLRLMDFPVPPHVGKAARTFRYNRSVFVARPWLEIYRQDAERKQTLEEAERTYRVLVEIYAAYGYELVGLPRAPVMERVRFVIDRLAGAA